MTLQTITKRDETSNERCKLGPTRHDFMDNSIVLLFPDCLQPIINVVVCTLTMNIFKPYAFNLKFKRFISIFIYLLNL
jgi:hypothetical protein